MAGWIKVHRKILNSEFYRGLTGRQRDVIITLLLMVNHEPREWIYKGMKYKTEPGQCVTSLQKIADRCGKDCTREVVRATIKHAESAHFLTHTTHTTHTVISIENWEKYQDVNTENTQSARNTDTKSTCVLNTNKNIRNKEYKKYSPDSDEFRLSNLLYGLIKKNNPKFKEPNLDNWCGHVDKMLRIDKRSVDDIEAVIRWCQQDDFWHKNILSTDKLRKQFDKLYMNMPKDKKVIPFKKDGDKDDWGYMQP